MSTTKTTRHVIAIPDSPMSLVLSLLVGCVRSASAALYELYGSTIYWTPRYLSLSSVVVLADLKWHRSCLTQIGGTHDLDRY